MQFKLALSVVLIFFNNSGYTNELSEKSAIAEQATYNVSITGFTRAHASIPVSTEVAGKIINIYADIGEPISDQEKFACLDDIFVRLDIEAANNEIAQYKNDISFFRKETSRHEKLTANQVSAVSVLDRLHRDLINSQKALQAAKIRKQRLEELKRRHCIAAPAGWLVIDRSIEVGQWVQEGMVVAHIGDYSKLIVPMLLTEQELASLKKEKKIEILLTEMNIKVPASIEHISPSFDEGSRKISVDLLLLGGSFNYRGGIRAELSLRLPREGHEFSISQNALEQRFEEFWLHREDGTSIRVNLVKTETDGKVVIRSPEIKAGDQFKMIH